MFTLKSSRKLTPLELLLKISLYGLCFMIVGSCMNLLVIMVNDWKMPVVSAVYGFNGGYISDMHVAASPSSNLLFLSDWIRIDAPLPLLGIDFSGWASPGDIFIYSGLPTAVIPPIIVLTLFLFNFLRKRFSDTE